MPDISAYKVIRDPRITLTPGGTHFRTEFTLPDDTNFRARAILAFIADPSSKATLSLEIELNGTVVKSTTFRGGDPRGLWEVLGANALEEGDNELRFTVPESTAIQVHGEELDLIANGKLGISDVVLWFTRTMPPAAAPRPGRPAPRSRARKR